MMEIIVSQVCEMFVLDFVGYKIEGFQFYQGGQDSERLLGKSGW